MKNFFTWALRIACFAVIGAAVYTLVGCLIHINDDYSAATIMGNNSVQTFQSGENSDGTTVAPQTTGIAQESVDENPSVIVYSDGTATTNRPYVTVTAAFGDIVNSIVADLEWYLDDELVSQEQQRLLVEGSTVSCKVDIDVERMESETADITLKVRYGEDELIGKTEILMSLPEQNEQDEQAVVIQTMEIPVTAKRTSKIYTGADLESSIGQMEKDDTGLLLAYEAENSGLRALRLLFSDGSSGWVDADDLVISEENCTVDEDYADADKESFVNSMKYDSQTGVMVWVSLYTQKVNVFSGYQGNWKLEKTFDCATGVNSTPTSTGTYHYTHTVERWNLGSTYVEPVLVFNGGEAFTSQPYDAQTNKIADDTMGEPASGGSVRMLEEDLQWMQENLPLASLVVVY